jgi:PPOX class probable F420-dependent enzyme
VTSGEARRRFASARVARLATADAGGRPHIVPIVFAVEGDIIYSAVDHKPKRTAALRRLANMAENPSVALLVDYYDDDWSRLWWARADGTGRLVATGSDERRQAISVLQSRYVEYVERPPAGPVVAVDVWRWSGWVGGSGTGERAAP